MPYVTLKFSLKIKHFVRQSLFFSLVLGGIGFSVVQAHSEILSDIEAHQFKIMPLEKSRTGRVYRFKVDAEQLPKTGAILLIEENDKPTMAFRVLKTDFDANEFVAKRVRRYDTTSELQINQRYVTIEKIGDLVAPPPPERGNYDPNAKPMLDPNPGKNLVDPNATPGPVPSLDPFNGSQTPAMPNAPVDTQPQAVSPHGKPLDVEKFDDDLDSSTSPTNLKSENTVEDASAKKDNTGDDNLDQPADMGGDDLDLEVKERVTINPYRFGLGFSIGSMKNLSNMVFNGVGGGGFSGFFSHVVERNLFFRKKVPQDSLSMEYGFSYYNLNNFNGHSDDYSFLPIKVELRYDIHLSETFSPFFYGGVQYNWIYSTTNVDVSNSTDNASYNKLHGFQANVGFGVFYNIGPQWYLRGEMGLDRLGVGLMVKW